MIFLDTDHITVLFFRNHSQHDSFLSRLTATLDQNLQLTVVSLEEQTRGWLAEIRRRRLANEQVPIYARLTELVSFYSSWEIAPFDEAAAAIFNDLRKRRVHIGTQDLKIASIALAHDALLLSANLRDFEQVPGLRVEDWLYSN